MSVFAEYSKQQHPQKSNSELLQPVSNCVLKHCLRFRITFRCLGEKQNIFHVVFQFGCYPSQTFSKINFVNSTLQLILNTRMKPAKARYYKDLYKHKGFSTDNSKILLSNSHFKRPRYTMARKGSRWDRQSIFPCMLQISVHNTKKGIMSGT